MRFQINLATQPYENVRRFLLAWGAALGAALLLTAARGYADSGIGRHAYHSSRLVAEERLRLCRTEGLDHPGRVLRDA